ncbi:tripartite tricarboxylate transporter substrate-binding protein [Rhodococcus sp. G-MC3]|uniref:Bug family tripartite tricarboxylate transporter substrate binding protein n=1 Tax=Rhodococcus sp. G-MC3 TaxID=3046209 RepID=UPI0024BB4A6A|nr:tripartite tricarboxylate transporter substrate-binding protein [Rhodococcus sp. G-MC3]MDJ0392544.1 tripartite tricarboxylate transporter substrate-binding protein [Rhodococcus sp. G-MC3]
MKRRNAASALCVSLAILVGGCSSEPAVFSGSEGNARVRFVVPSDAGGGYDLTARNLTQTLATDDTDYDVVVLPGSGGVVGLGRLALEVGNPDLAMVMGLGLIGALETTISDRSIADVAPIAKLLEEPEVVLVPASSPLQTMSDLVSAWRADPAGLKFAGGSAEGGPDGLFRVLLARAIGVDAEASYYRQFEGGGQLLPALLTGDIDVATTGVSEYLDQITAGTVRALAISTAERVEVIDAPTAREAGVDVVFANWRGLLAPPGLTDEQLDVWTDRIRDLDDSAAWQDVLTRNGWRSSILTGDDFAEFISEQAAFVHETLPVSSHS